MIELAPGANDSYWCPDDPGEYDLKGGHARLSVTREEVAILQGLFAGRRVLEVGTGLGVSTRAIAEAAELVVTHDVDPWVIENVAPDLPENVKFVDCRPFPPGCDAAFIDGNHRTDSVARDLLDVSAAIGPGRVIAMHDLHFADVVRGASQAGVHVFHTFDTKCKLSLAWSVAVPS